MQSSKNLAGDSGENLRPNDASNFLSTALRGISHPTRWQLAAKFRCCQERVAIED
jgi:hypothetical protein